MSLDLIYYFSHSLLEAGAEVNQANNNGKTPLMAAAQEGHEKVVKALLEAGADIEAKNKNGDTALTLAVKNDHLEVVKILEAPITREV